MKITNIPLLLASLADSYDAYVAYVAVAEGIARTPVASGPAQLAAMVRAVLDLHEHRLWKRRVPDQPGAGFVPTTDMADAELAECKACGEVDADLFWCKHIRAMFAAMCDVEGQTVDAAEWPDLAEAVRRARREFEAPVASAVVRSLTNASYSSASRIELATAVLAGTPTRQESQ